MRLNAEVLRYMTKEEFRVLTAVEMGHKNHEFVPLPLIHSIACLKRHLVKDVIASLLKNKLLYRMNQKYEGVKLTYLGYDYLALHAFVKRDLISGVGVRIGVRELSNPERILEKLMQLIVRLGRAGLIHGDFNEFNLMIDDKEHVTVIDLPQVVSTLHPNAEMYFERDVECIRNLFAKKFNIEVTEAPRFRDVCQVTSSSGTENSGSAGGQLEECDLTSLRVEEVLQVEELHAVEEALKEARCLRAERGDTENTSSCPESDNETGVDTDDDSEVSGEQWHTLEAGIDGATFRIDERLQDAGGDGTLRTEGMSPRRQDAESEAAEGDFTNEAHELNRHSDASSEDGADGTHQSFIRCYHPKLRKDEESEKVADVLKGLDVKDLCIQDVEKCSYKDEVLKVLATKAATSTTPMLFIAGEPYCGAVSAPSYHELVTGEKKGDDVVSVLKDLDVKDLVSCAHLVNRALLNRKYSLQLTSVDPMQRRNVAEERAGVSVSYFCAHFNIWKATLCYGNYSAMADPAGTHHEGALQAPEATEEKVLQRKEDIPEWTNNLIREHKVVVFQRPYAGVSHRDYPDTTAFGAYRFKTAASLPQ
ncbi:UNVERIFIED_CONTAM: hypothetical protein H355_007851 [Colinus virginianus]|nr:hypothetical protein H355_007851 [Colinus virginianus]